MKKHPDIMLVGDLPKEDLEELAKAYREEVKNDLMGCWDKLPFNSFVTIFTDRDDRPKLCALTKKISKKLYKGVRDE